MTNSMGHQGEKDVAKLIGKHAHIKMRLLGIIHGDGNTSRGRLNITDMSEEYHKNVLAPMFLKAFNVKMNVFHEIQRNSYSSHTKRRNVYNFFTDTLQVPKGAVRNQLFVPAFVKSASIYLQREYVGGLYDAEGSVRRRQAEIYFSITNKEIYEFVKTVLKSAQIGFSIYERHRNIKPEYEIYIYGKDDLMRFNKLIKFEHPDKIKELLKHIDVY